ncbi:MFS transporter [Alkalihalobacillus sp. FSL R5-0424]
METKNNHQVPLWSLSFLFVTLSNALLFMVFEMMLPTLPLFVVSVGGSANQVGLVTGIFMLSAILIRPFAGILAQKIDKKYLLIIGLIISSLCTGLYYLSSDIWMILLFRLIHGAGFGLATTYFATIAAENIPVKRRGEGMGYFGVGETIAISVGPLIGIAALQTFGYKTLFLGGMCVSFLSILMALFIKRRGKNSKEHNNNVTRFKLIERKVLIPSLLMLLIGVAASSVMSFVALYAVEYEFNYVGWFFFIVAIASFLVRLVSGKVFDRRGPGYVLVPSAILGIIGFLVLYLANTDLVFLLAAVFYGSGFGAIFPAIQTWCINLVEEHEHENAMASFFNFFDLGIGGGSILFGFVATIYSYQTLYLIAGLTYVLFIFVYSVYSYNKKIN